MADHCPLVEYTSHLLVSRLTSHHAAYAYMHCSYIVAGRAYIMHILCARVLHNTQLIIAVALACALAYIEYAYIIYIYII